ncbi:TolC family protein [Flavobacteriaceae bacterium]|nr:TolC family protein [Flavobacteriaceae bacterium]
MKHIYKIVLSVFSITTSLSQEKLWDLQQCVDYALENNISILQAQNTILSNDQDIIASKGNFLPSLSSNLNQSMSIGTVELYPGEFADRTFNSSSVGFNISQTVFNGFRNLNVLRQSKINLERSENELNKIKDDVSLNVANNYLNILFSRENLALAKSQYEFSFKQLQQIRNLVEAGVQPQANIIDAEATLSLDEQNLTSAENNYKLSLLTLSQILQIPLEGFNVVSIDVEVPSENLLYSDIKPVLNYALVNRNEIKVANNNIELAKYNTKISKSAYLPSVSFGYGFNASANFSNLTSDNSFFQQINDNKGHSLNMNISVPIFSRNQIKTNVAKSKIQENNSDLGLIQAKLNVEATVQRAYTDAKAALKSYQAAKKSLQSQQLAFENSQQRYQLGAINTIDLEQVRFRLLNAQSSLINSKYDFIFKTKVLDFYMGK